jgi:adenine-specific DNA methylase
LDIAALAALSRKEKSARQGHISTLAFWFARRPTGLSRALIVAAGAKPELVEADTDLANALERRYGVGSTARAITRLTTELGAWAAYRDKELMDLAGRVLRVSGCTRLVDPFGGGGSIPLEGARLGLSIGAGDLNPAAAIVLRTMLVELPASSTKLLDAFDATIAAAQTSLEATSGDAVSAILWSWVRHCQECGDRYPLIANPLLSSRRGLYVGLRRRGNAWQPYGAGEADAASTVSFGKSTCPNCGWIVASADLMAERKSGDHAELPYAVVRQVGKSREYSFPGLNGECANFAQPGVDEAFLRGELDPNGIRHLWAMAYGVTSVRDVYSARQAAQLSAAIEALRAARTTAEAGLSPIERSALAALVAFVAVRLCLYNSRHSWWQGKGEFPAQTFTRQALAMVWNYCEIPPTSRQAGGLESAASWVRRAAHELIGGTIDNGPTIWCGPAEAQPVPSDSVDLVLTDPPYYDSVTYAYLSDVFYPIYREALADHEAWRELVRFDSSPREREAIVDRPHGSIAEVKGDLHFRDVMAASFAECWRVLKPTGSMVVMYGHKEEAAWDALLDSIARARFQITDAVEVTAERGAKFSHSRVAHLEECIAISCRPLCRSEEAETLSVDALRALVAHSREHSESPFEL